MVEAVLSDIDGTLVESNWLHAAAWRVARTGIPDPIDLLGVISKCGGSQSAV
jgi:beta-phosphoglucomutase-like phosphatase (HAD superfamily)